MTYLSYLCDGWYDISMSTMGLECLFKKVVLFLLVLTVALHLVAHLIVLMQQQQFQPLNPVVQSLWAA